MLHRVKYRTWFKGVPPRPIKLEVPGWAGIKTWETGQPWHCKPFCSAATYGVELIYPFNTEVTVTAENGVCDFQYESDKEWREINQTKQFPFSNFTPNHSIDLKTEPDYSTLILPHPRFFTDMTGSVPLPSCGMLESDWWPKIFFIAFRAPLPGHKYVFRKGEGYAQLMFVPHEAQYQIEQMSAQEARDRQETEWLMSILLKHVSSKKWKDKFGQVFNNAYKTLSLVARKDGPAGVLEHLRKVHKEVQTNRPKQALTNTNLFKPHPKNVTANK
jgi:hypothetical protein